MTGSRKAFVVGLLAAAPAMTATPASAVPATFATYSSLGSGRFFEYQNSGTSTKRLTDATIFTTKTNNSNIPGSTNVRFNFLPLDLRATIGELVASYTYLAQIEVANPATLLGNQAFSQNGISGQFSLLSTTVIDFRGVTYAIGSNLLSGTFGGSTLNGTLKGTSGSTFSSTAADNSVVFTSDFLDFSNTVERDRGLTLTGVNRPFSIAPNGALSTFHATVGGQFSADPSFVIVGTVPEPSVLGLTLLGLGMIGFAVRRQRAIAA